MKKLQGITFWLQVDDDDDKQKLSKRKLKKLNRLSVAELKQLVSRPDVVEMHDVTAKDPGLLVALKATRNTVPVPRHWCFKRKYLQVSSQTIVLPNRQFFFAIHVHSDSSKYFSTTYYLCLKMVISFLSF